MAGSLFPFSTFSLLCTCMTIASHVFCVSVLQEILKVRVDILSKEVMVME